MQRLTLAATVLMLVGSMGCDRLPFIGGGDEETATQEQQVAPTDTAQMAEPAVEAQVPTPQQDTMQVETPRPQVEPAPPPQRTSGPSLVDEPWTPTHTGTVEPGMTREQVVAVWGEPATERSLGDWTYMHFRNGCEVTCGTFDVVLLQGGQVVDAIVRGPGHTYAGVSSSPPDRAAEFTPPEGRPGN
jgi:hypothetical protein